MPKINPDELVSGIDMGITIALVGMVKELAALTGESSGELPCPRCHDGTLYWSVAPSNGHARVKCDREYEDDKGRLFFCTEAME